MEMGHTRRRRSFRSLSFAFEISTGANIRSGSMLLILIVLLMEADGKRFFRACFVSQNRLSPSLHYCLLWGHLHHSLQLHLLSEILVLVIQGREDAKKTIGRSYFCNYHLLFANTLDTLHVACWEMQRLPMQSKLVKHQFLELFWTKIFKKCFPCNYNVLAEMFIENFV